VASTSLAHEHGDRGARPSTDAVERAGWIFATAFAEAIAAPLRREGKFTIGDVMSKRLGGRALRISAGLSAVTISIIYLVGQLVGAGVLIAALFGIGFTASVVIVGLLMTIYVTVGGMLAATWVQIIKAGLLIAIVILLSVLCVIEAGGIGPLYDRAVAVSPLGRDLFVPGASNTSLFSAVSLGFGMTMGMLGLPHLLIRFFTVPDEKAARASVVSATSIIGGVFLLLFAIIGPGAVAFVKNNPEFMTAEGGVLGGANLASVHLAEALGGEVLMGITSAVAFATLLAVVAGLVMASASAAAHDLFASLRASRPRSEASELRAFRLSAGGIGLVAVLLAIAFQHENVAFLSALAFAVSASANVPVLLLILYWKRVTVAGALAGGLFGLVSSVTLIILGPSVWVKLLGHAEPVFPSDYPALITMPLALLVAVAVSLAAAP
jgi:cation/acetate symporter